MKNLAIIPARSGSKGIKDKNILMLDGKPLLAYTVEAAIKSKMFDEVYVSTDSERYAEIARQYGADVPFLRSEETSTDTSSSWSVVREAIERFRERGMEFDTFALLQPTTPLRNDTDIVNAFGLLEQKKANAILSVCETKVPGDTCNALPEDLSLVGFYDDRKYKPRQSRPTYYNLNGAIYLCRTDAFLRQQTIYDEKCYAYIMSKLASTDIDDMDDVFIVEAIIKHKKETGR